MKTKTNNEEAVTPIIATVLLVAMTVILAAVVMAMVFGMTGDVTKTKIVGFAVHKENANAISVVNHGGQDQSALVKYSIVTVPFNTTGIAGVQSKPAVGSNATAVPVTAGAYAGNTRVRVIGEFTDGTSQIMLDTAV